jgi:enoyl-CoA hydratase/carnithine racemase
MVVDHVQDGVTVTVTLQRIAKRNAIDDTVRKALRCILVHGPDPVSRLLVLRAQGSIFSSGNDLEMLGGAAARGRVGLAEQQVKDLRLLHDLFAYPLPTMAVLQGPVYGYAADIVASCDWVIATPTATFHWPEWRYGIVASGTALQRLGPAFLWQGMSEGVTAEVALAGGLVNELVDCESVDKSLRARTEWVEQLPEGVYQAWRAGVLDLRRRPASLWSRLPGLWAPGETE